MENFMQSSVYLGIILSLVTYEIGVLIQKAFKRDLFNPLLISVALVILILSLTGISYDTYYKGAYFLNWLLTPATVCLAIPLYERFELLKKNWKALLAGILSGVLTCMVIVLALSFVFKLSHAEYVTLLPKSITTAIGMAVTEELGGYVTITVAIILITGIFGNVFAETFCRMFKITDPMAKGIAIGTSSHALGTSKAIQMGDTEGAISSLSIAVCGLLTVIIAPIFAAFF